MLGLRRGTVKLVRSNSKEWARLFEKEKKLLSTTFGNRIIAIEHIGSTSIPKLISKPIIDIDVIVKSLPTARAMKSAFVKLGYTHRPRPGLPWQMLYVKGPNEKRTHYAHVIPIRSDRWKDDLGFRDYLRTHTGARNRYAKLKRKLAKLYSNDRMTYTTKKEGFILDIVHRAKTRNTPSQSK